VYYSAALAALTSFASAASLPKQGAFWWVARILLDGAGAAFGLYLIVAVALSLVGVVMRARHRDGAHHAVVVEQHTTARVA
jgi:Fe2+ transport system protein B